MEPDYSNNSPTRNNRRDTEIDRLRTELFYSRQQVAEQTKRIQVLEEIVEDTRQSESLYNAKLALSMEKVEENLDKSNVRNQNQFHNEYYTMQLLLTLIYIILLFIRKKPKQHKNL